MVKFREAASTLIHASRDTVYGILASSERPSRHGRVSEVVRRVPNERVDVMPRAGGRNTEAWFILKDAPGGTRVVHGAAYTPKNVIEAIRMRMGTGDALREAVNDELHLVKCLAESHSDDEGNQPAPP